ncbi:MAG: carotenoid biosynthesis protein, partial [Bacteroidota bacterium]
HIFVLPPVTKANAVISQATFRSDDTFSRYLTYFLLFAFASGTLAHCLPAVLPVTKVTTDGLLFVLNGLVLYAIYRSNQDRRLFWWLLVAYWFTFAMEAIGVATGAVFGDYAYGPTMWLQWLGVPFVIALNWCVLTLACNELACRILGTQGEKKLQQAEDSTTNPLSHIPYPLSLILPPALAAVFTALYDVAIEPVAIQLDYWQWAGGAIPLQNYLAWAAIAFLISVPLYIFRIRFRSPVLLVYLFAQLFFFLVLNLML